MERIGIFQFDWPLQSHTLNLALSLAANGYEVDLVVSGCREDLVDLDRAAGTQGFNLIRIDLTSSGCATPQTGVVACLRRSYREAVQGASARAVLAPYFFSSLYRLRRRNYAGLIGVEKMGLIWAGWLACYLRVPFFYFSLELYDEEHPYFFERPGFPALRRAEKRFHAKALATIVQDELRGAHLLRSNGCAEGRLITLPVSVSGRPVLSKGSFFRERFGLPPDRPIVLYLGLIDEARGCLDLAALAKRFQNEFSLVFHGYGQLSFLAKLKEAGRDALFVSEELVAEEDLPALVASSDIGLALYRRDCANDRMTAFSSEKVALYCRAGLPFVAFDDETYRRLSACHPCCELVTAPGEIPAAVGRILANYEEYRSNAFDAFSEYYCYEGNILPVVEQIGQMLAGSN